MKKSQEPRATSHANRYLVTSLTRNAWQDSMFYISTSYTKPTMIAFNMGPECSERCFPGCSRELDCRFTVSKDNEAGLKSAFGCPEKTTVSTPLGTISCLICYCFVKNICQWRLIFQKNHVWESACKEL